jgi:hypothetical protein
MNRTLFVVLAVVLAISFGVTIYAAGAKTATTETEAPMMSCPCCGMTMGGMKGGADMAGRMKEMQAKMKEAGVSEETMKAHMAMMKAPLYLDSPEMLLGQADALGLTDDQKAQLTEVVSESRAKAAAVLTEAQVAQLGPVAEKPMTLMEMRAEMMKKMAPMMEKMGKEKGMGGTLTNY